LENRILKPESSPYVGPRPFEQKDRNLFYGRNYETLEIISLILSNPLTLIYSQSGVGKTSLFNTKIMYELEKQYKFKTFPSARVRSLISPEKIPKDVTNMYMFNTLLCLKADANVETMKNQSLSNFLKQDGSRTNKEGYSMPRIIVFDQMEELFGLYPDNWYDQQQDFFQQIAEALSEDNMLRIVFIIREEYLAYLSSFAQLLPGKLRARFRLERLRKDAALEAVLEPLKQTGGFVFGPGVAEKLVDDLLTMRVETIFGKIVDMKGNYVEPVHLQVVCQRLWMKAAQRGITEITQEHLKGSADVNHALTEFYLEIIASAARYTGVSKDTIRNWFNKYLITSSGTRGMVHREEKSTGGLPNKVVDFLQERYLIRQELRSGSRWYELTHDRLIGPIRESNKEWNEKKKVKKLRVATVLLPTAAIIGVLLVAYLIGVVPESTKPVPLQVTYQGTFGSQNLGSENLSSHPASVEYSGVNDRIYVADLDNDRIQVLDSKGNLLKSWGTKGNATGQFDHPGDVAVDPITGYVYVSDIANNRIQKFDSDGKFIGKWGSAGAANGQFNHPGDIVIDPSRRFVYVIDDHNNRVQKFDTTGKFISKWGSAGIHNGQFRFPTGITIDGNGRIYVSDTFNNRIQKFDENGHFISKWGSTGSDILNFNRPDGVTYDIDHNLLYVSDRKNGRIVVLTDAGKPWYNLVLSAVTKGLDIKPRDVSLDNEGKLYVADKDNNRIHIFTTRPPTS